MSKEKVIGLLKEAADEINGLRREKLDLQNEIENFKGGVQHIDNYLSDVDLAKEASEDFNLSLNNFGDATDTMSDHGSMSAAEKLDDFIG